MNKLTTFGTTKPGTLPKLLVNPIKTPAKSGAISTCVELKPLNDAPLNVTANMSSIQLTI